METREPPAKNWDRVTITYHSKFKPLPNLQSGEHKHYVTNGKFHLTLFNIQVAVKTHVLAKYYLRLLMSHVYNLLMKEQKFMFRLRSHLQPR